MLWKWLGLFLKKNHPLRFWGWFSLLNLIETLTLSLLLELPPRKLEPLFVLWSFFLLRLLCISINPPYAHEWKFFQIFEQDNIFESQYLGFKKAANLFSRNSRWKFFQDQLKRDFPEVSFEDLKRLNVVPGYKKF